MEAQIRRRSSSSLLLSSLELSDTQVYEPYIRALLGTPSHFCDVVDLKLGTVSEWNRKPAGVQAREHGQHFGDDNPGAG